MLKDRQEELVVSGGTNGGSAPPPPPTSDRSDVGGGVDVGVEGVDVGVGVVDHDDRTEETLLEAPTPPDECAGCGASIHDRYYLLAADRRWHGSCLRCCECLSPLAGELTCFTRDRNIYCKEDYYRMFCVKRCARCGAGISANELVMRARELVFHLACFACASCARPLNKGDTFGVRDSLLYCRAHYDLMFADAHHHHHHHHHHGLYGGGGPADEDLVAAMFRANDSPSQYGMPVQKGRPRKRKPQQPQQPHSPDSMHLHAIRMAGSALEMLHGGAGDLSLGGSESNGGGGGGLESLSYESSVASPGSATGRHSSQRTKRMRTSFKHHQLRTMKSYFAINQNPDAKDLKQLAQKTGLSKRVLQVWFQNARAKWRRNMLRQEVVVQNGGGSSSSQGQPQPQQPPPLHHQHQAMPFTDLY